MYNKIDTLKLRGICDSLREKEYKLRVHLEEYEDTKFLEPGKKKLHKKLQNQLKAEDRNLRKMILGLEKVTEAFEQADVRLLLTLDRPQNNDKVDVQLNDLREINKQMEPYIFVR